MRLKILVIYGSVRSDRQGIKAARFILSKLKERGHDVELIDPVQYKLPLLDKMYKEYKQSKAPRTLEKLAKMIKEADAYVIVSGEYNHSPPPALMNLLDHFLEEYFFKPSAVVSYSSGPWGGVRSTSHLRDFLAEMGMPTIPTSLPVPKVQDAFDDKGNPKEGESWDRRSKQFIEELEWYALALKNQRKKGRPY